MTVKWNNCFLCLNALGSETTTVTDGSENSKKSGQLNLLLNYLLETKCKRYAPLIKDVKELFSGGCCKGEDGGGSAPPGIKFCVKCEGQLSAVSRLHQELEVVQMKLVNVLKLVRQTVISGSRGGGEGDKGNGCVGLFDEWVKEQEGKGGDLEDEVLLVKQQRRILDSLYLFQAGVIENDKTSIDIPRIFLDKCTQFKPEPITSSSEVIIKTEATADIDLDNFLDELHSPEQNDDFVDNFPEPDAEPQPQPAKKARKGGKNTLSTKVKEEIKDFSRPVRASSSMARVRIAEIKKLSTKAKRVKKELIDPPPPRQRFKVPPALSMKIKPNFNKTKNYSRPSLYFVCAACDYANINQFSFEHHLRTHEVPVDEQGSTPNLQLFTCEKCAITFSVKQNYQFHMACHDGKLMASCDVCDVKCDLLTLAYHMKTHLDKVFPCPNCSFCSSTRDKYLQHLACHDGKSCLLECDICRETCGSRRDLLQHYDRVHQAIDKLVCGEDGCQKTFLDPNMLRIHKRYHTKMFTCPECELVLVSKTSLQNHLLRHTGERPFPCDKCAESFTIKASLERHLVREHGAPKVKCEYCDKEFTELPALKTHTTRFHTVNSKITCQFENCGKSFGNNSQLKRHMISHSTERKFVCEECGAGFKAESNLKKHRLIHGGEKKFKCQYCEKAFLYDKYLIAHLRIHTGEKPFVCDACGKDFNQYAALYLHKRKCQL